MTDLRTDRSSVIFRTSRDFAPAAVGVLLTRLQKSRPAPSSRLGHWRLSDGGENQSAVRLLYDCEFLSRFCHGTSPSGDNRIVEGEKGLGRRLPCEQRRSGTMECRGILCAWLLLIVTSISHNYVGSDVKYRISVFAVTPDVLLSGLFAQNCFGRVDKKRVPNLLTLLPVQRFIFVGNKYISSLAEILLFSKAR